MNYKTLKASFLWLGVTLAMGSLAFGQVRVGKPGGNTPNFFNTSGTNNLGDPLGNVLGHEQVGPFGSINNPNSRWIGIGQAAIPSQEVYGMRIQDQGYTSTFSLNGTPGVKDLELQWGGPDFTFPFLRFNFLTNPFSSREVMNLNGNGRLRIAPENNNSGTVNLIVRGSAQLTGNLFQNSDRRLKENILPLRSMDELEDVAFSKVTRKLLQLEGVTYQMRSDEEERDQIGFIAQDVKKLFPELVIEDEEGNYAVNYSGLIPVLVEGVKEQQEVMDQQANIIEKLSEKIDRLEKQMNSIGNER